MDQKEKKENVLPPLDSFREETKKEFGNVNAHLEDVENSLDNVENRLNRIERKLDRAIDRYDRKIDNHEKRVLVLEGKKRT
mgnify:CR=1 FL=1